MSSVSFKTKSGQKVSFKAGKKRRTRKLSAYNRFVAKHIKGRKAGQSVQTAMKSAAKAWKNK